MPLLGGFALIVLFVQLGFWQLRRGDEARALDAAMLAQERVAPLELSAARAVDVSALSWRRATVHGHWMRSDQVLLDNQVMAGQAGYLVFAPFRIDGCDCAVLVNRGWIAAGPDRSHAPAGLAPPHAVSEVGGQLAPPPPTGVGTGGEGREALGAGLMRVQRIDPSSLSTAAGIRLLPLTLRLDAVMPDGYARNWQAPAGRAQRHLAYAAQWFAMALALLVLVARLNWRPFRQSNLIRAEERSPSWIRSIM